MRPVVSVLAFAGCTARPDAAALRALADAVEARPVEERGAALLAGLVAPGVGVVPLACAEQVGLALGGPPGQRDTLLANALAESCPRPCGLDGKELGRLAGGPAVDVLAVCDSSGPDPVLGDPALAELRRWVKPVDTLAARVLLGPALVVTDGTELGPRYVALARDAAVSLVVAAGPSETEELSASPNLDATPGLPMLVRAAVGCPAGSVRAVVNGNGRVIAAAPEGCIAAGVRTAVLPATRDGGYAVVDHVRGPAAVDLPGYDAVRSVVTGGLTTEQVRATFTAELKTLHVCHERGKKGLVILEVDIAADGTVSAASGGSPTAPPTMVECIVAKVRGWRFAEAADGAPTHFTRLMDFRRP